MGLWSYTYWPLVPYTAAGQGVRADGRVRGGGLPAPRIGVCAKLEGLHFLSTGL
jgi:hypothetical protein